MTDKPGSAHGVYGIAVAAEISGIGEQTLRLYERRGVLTPSRTPGGTRRYSEKDMVVVERVSQLLTEGFNLLGVRRILELEADNAELRSRIEELTLSNRSK